MLSQLDYILDNDGHFWIISHKQGNDIYGKIIYRKSDDGNRYNKITQQTYVKEHSSLTKIPNTYQMEFHPQKFYLEHKKDLDGVWKKYAEAMNAAGIPDCSIGIFGSYLIGFDIVKDVDFSIYGLDNLYRYYRNRQQIKELIGATSISEWHVNYQYAKYKDDYHPECGLHTILSRNWSGVQIKDGVLSTPRFICDSYVIPRRNGKDKIIKCKVLSGLTSACFPRFAMVQFEGKTYQMITPFWMFQSFAKDGDILELHGNINETNRTILLDCKDDYIKYL